MSLKIDSLYLVVSWFKGLKVKVKGVKGVKGVLV